MPKPSHTLSRYGVSIVTVGLALLLTLQVRPLADRTPFALFFAGVMFSTWYGGRKPGLLTIALSALAADYFIIPPLHSLVPSLLNLPEISTFILVSLLINFLTAARQHSEKSLRQSEESYRIIAKTASDAIITIDESSTILFVNQAAEKIFGYSTKEMLGQSLTILMPDYLREVHRAGLSRYLTTGEKHLNWSSIELPGLHKSGREIPLELSFGELIRDGQHRFTGIVRDISRRKRADEALKVSESELRALFAAMTDVILVLNSEGRYLKIAPTDPAYLYKPPDDLIGKKLHEVFPREEADFFLAHIRRALDEGQMHRVEYRLELEEKEVWFDGSVSPLSRDSVVWIARDITERKRAEEALYESEERYRLLFESNPHPMWVYDLETLRFLTVNEAAIHHYGYTREEFLSLTISDIRPEEDIPALLENVSKLNGTLDIAGVWRHRRKDGSLIDVEVVSHGLIFDGRRAELVLVNDVTERKRTEEALREADQRAIREYEQLLVRVASLAQVLGTARDLTTIFRALRDFAVISAPCSGLFVSLYDPGQDVRTAAYAWSEGEEVDVATLPPMQMTGSPQSRAVSTGRIIITDDFQSAMKGRPTINLGLDADPRLPQSSLAVPMTVMGRIVGAVEVQSTEIAAFRAEHATAIQMAANLAANAIETVRLLESERVQAEQLRQSQKLESVGQLAGGIAHDFNNLLTAITGYGELTLKRLGENDPLRRNIEEIIKAGDRAASLTRQLLAFSRKQVLQPVVLDLNDVVADMDKLLRRLIGEHIHLVAMRDPGLGRIKADPGQLSQVIINLALNARDAMPEGGKLTIETKNVELNESYVRQHLGVRPGRYVMLAISDTGKGMDAATQKQIFEPFFTTKEVGKGTGLGLSMVYGVVKQSGGDIWVYSEPGQGTTFKIYLPQVEEKVEDVEQVAAKVPKGTETILLVEDDDMVRELLRSILEIEGYTTLVASHGDEALGICERHEGPLDLLITDVVMPGMSGRQLVERLTAKCAEVKVLYMSGYTDNAIVHHGVLDPGVAFLQKPFTPDTVARKVREVLDAAGAK
jgi:two-component system cell cycle sensor histidine kinase/response regulator CckA